MYMCIPSIMHIQIVCSVTIDDFRAAWMLSKYHSMQAAFQNSLFLHKNTNFHAYSFDIFERVSKSDL